ncbi:MAG: hypothetical protein HOK52_09080 [Candidatus Marinimicrobia bacterium]|jgi:hypothetical protein|nr:hypothetical protein [Candidatus Neomarinimicrobiota bacterium]
MKEPLPPESQEIELQLKLFGGMFIVGVIFLFVPLMIIAGLLILKLFITGKPWDPRR